MGTQNECYQTGEEVSPRKLFSAEADQTQKQFPSQIFLRKMETKGATIARKDEVLGGSASLTGPPDLRGICPPPQMSRPASYLEDHKIESHYH